MHFLKIDDLRHEQIKMVFERASRFKMGEVGRPLEGKTVALFFPSSSIRTRLSFEKAIALLGGHSVLFEPAVLDKREALADVAGYMGNWADLIVVRHPNLRRVEALAKESPVPVINAMTSDNHPCEILSDLYSISRLKGSFEKLVFTFVGEAGNIGKTWFRASHFFGFQLRHASLLENRMGPEDDLYSFSTDLDELLPGTDLILTDPLPDALRQETYYEAYQIDERRLALAGTDVLLNPCPPFFRGEEVSIGAINSGHFVGYDFKKSLLYVQMALVCQVMDRACSGVSNE